MQCARLTLNRWFNKLEDGLQGILLLSPIEFVTVHDRGRVIITRPP